ncbi:unnamed protein product [Amoebophrya sp. A25]|nr:unnamed protein product [Amoebophrya sp. A25]|eukprot:GSA25T00018294001.1
MVLSTRCSSLPRVVSRTVCETTVVAPLQRRPVITLVEQPVGSVTSGLGSATASSSSSSSLRRETTVGPAFASRIRYSTSASPAIAQATSYSSSTSSTSSSPSTITHSATKLASNYRDLSAVVLTKEDEAVALELVQKYAAMELRPVTLAQIAQNGIDTEFLQREWLIRLSHRIQDFRALSYAVTSSAKFFETYQLYLKTLLCLEGMSPAFLEKSSGVTGTLMQQHSVVPEALQVEYSNFRDSHDLTDFFDKIFITRIGNRVLGESFQRGRTLVTEQCSVADVVREVTPLVRDLCRQAYGSKTLGEVPDIELTGDLDVRFSFIHEHLGFILQELLKNSLRAVVENSIMRRKRTAGLQGDSAVSAIAERAKNAAKEQAGQGGKSSKPTPKDTTSSSTSSLPGAFPPVIVEIQKGDFDVIIKVSDQGGGIPRTNIEDVWRYGFTTVDLVASNGTRGGNGNGVSTPGCASEPGPTTHHHSSGAFRARTHHVRKVAGYGFGLPLARLYARYFGGDIHLQSMFGFGTDAYISLNHLGNVREAEGTADFMTLESTMAGV